ncbi:uncharacterized protein [Spinacia oleracea]|uniref:Retrovirus-related Pol polyprotein from transposon TNT 1-94-like beta-barrel domain-containing protein n=1 Tax=Spinacia oleracea TaxID=3562 RepID=A0ABM3RPZ0_SPIOL|nr:uncharacterized protein LOC110776401 [Spinacia oleracea]
MKHSETDDKLDNAFSGTMTYFSAKYDEWIMDSGASDHMTGILDLLTNVRKAPSNLTINLPTGAREMITHYCDITLSNGLEMMNVLYVPQFKHNLVSIHKLYKDNLCDVMFSPRTCTVVDSLTKELRGKGEMKHGLYYLKGPEEETRRIVGNASSGTDLYDLWHHRLGHAPKSKLRYIPCVQPYVKDKTHTCITCPMSKFTKLLFSLSDSHAAQPFELIHIDLWGPTELPTPVLQNKTPYEALNNSPPNYDHLIVLGCLSIATNPDQTGDKFEARGVPCVFLGYLPHPNTSPNTNPNTEPVTQTHQPNEPVFPPPLRRSIRPTKPPTWMEHYVNPSVRPSANVLTVTQFPLDKQLSCFLSTMIRTTDPVHFKHVVAQRHWVDAMNTELEALELNGTWEITTFPPGKHVIGCKWLYKTKRKKDGTI